MVGRRAKGEECLGLMNDDVCTCWEIAGAMISKIMGYEISPWVNGHARGVVAGSTGVGRSYEKIPNIGMAGSKSI